MAQIDLKVKRVVVFGLQGSGKSAFTRWLIKKSSQPTMIYDWHDEYSKIDRSGVFSYVPQFKDDIEKRIVELNEVMQNFVLKTKKIKLIVIDEANQYCPPKPIPLPFSMRDVNDNHRHYGQSLIFISRRPTQLHSDLVELAHYRVFFNLTGKNDLAYCDALKSGFGEIVQNLKRFEFAILDNFGNVSISPPVRMI